MPRALVESVRFDVKLVGGPFDGADVPQWDDGGSEPPPDRILVGVCGRGRDCGAQSCTVASKHASWWIEEETKRPSKTVPYVKESEAVGRTERDGHTVLQGSVVYAIGGLTEPKNFGEKAREPLAAV